MNCVASKWLDKLVNFYEIEILMVKCGMKNEVKYEEKVIGSSVGMEKEKELYEDKKKKN